MPRRVKQTLATERLESRACPAVVGIGPDQAAAEGRGPVQVTVRLDAPSAQPVAVGYFLGGEATADRDFRLTIGSQALPAPTGTISFRPGETSKVITLTPLDDMLREDTEQCSITLTPLRNATIGARTATVTIADNDAYSAWITGQPRVQPGEPAEFTVRLSSPATRVETFYVSTVAESATPAADFRPLSRFPLVFTRGDSSKTFRIPILANTEGESDEMFVVRVATTSPGFPSVAPFAVTIVGDGTPPPPGISVAPTSVVEGNTGMTIDWVRVGDAGNAVDDTGFGGVNYEYQIGKYEITIGQYAKFLNAVARTDPHGLYNANMATNLTVAGIARAGTAGGYNYTVISNDGTSANRPITYVSWFDAARFANWMHNGQGNGGTESGAYTLVGGQTSGAAPTRNPEAKFWIPNEDEWYKAAYYKGGGTDAGYWEYATQSDSAPDNVVGAGANQANYFTDVYAVTQSPAYAVTQRYTTDVGAFSGSPSAYGTFDQSGNVQELTTQSRLGPELIGRRGGDWYSPAAFDISATHSPTIPSWDDGFAIGFRLASPVAATPAPEARRAWFTVSLSTASTLPVTVSYATADGTATTADDDYTAVDSGTIEFAPGETVKSVGVTITGDTRPEADETFTLRLSDPVNGWLQTASATGTIRNDDSGTPPPPQGTWTILVYMTGENLNQYARDDINEMERFVATLPANSGVRILVGWDQPNAAAGTAYATGGSPALWRTYGRSVLVGDTSNLIASTFDISLGERNTGDPATLVDFLRWGAERAPAANYALQLWGHGRGLDGSQFDSESGGDALTINEIGAALGSPGLPPLRMVSYDNCLMGMAEVGFAVAQRFSGHFVASEELVNATGQNYGNAFAALGRPGGAENVTSATLAAGMVASYQAQYAGDPAGNDTFSAVVTGGYTQLGSALAQFVTATDPLSAANRTTLRTLATAAPSLSFEEASFRDLGRFMSRVAASANLPQPVRNAATAVNAAIAAMVTAKTSDSRGSNGMAIYLPTVADAYLSNYTATATAFCNATGWDRFVRWLATGTRSADAAFPATLPARHVPAGTRSAAGTPAAFAALYWAAERGEAARPAAGPRGRPVMDGRS